MVFEMCVSEKVVLVKKPIPIGNSRGFRIKKSEMDLEYSKCYKIVVEEKI